MTTTSNLLKIKAKQDGKEHQQEACQPAGDQ
jgi:hypothetical protein